MADAVEVDLAAQSVLLVTQEDGGCFEASLHGIKGEGEVALVTVARIGHTQSGLLSQSLIGSEAVFEVSLTHCGIARIGEWNSLAGCCPMVIYYGSGTHLAAGYPEGIVSGADFRDDIIHLHPDVVASLAFYSLQGSLVAVLGIEPLHIDAVGVVAPHLIVLVLGILQIHLVILDGTTCVGGFQDDGKRLFDAVLRLIGKSLAGKSTLVKPQTLVGERLADEGEALLPVGLVPYLGESECTLVHQSHTSTVGPTSQSHLDVRDSRRVAIPFGIHPCTVSQHIDDIGTVGQISLHRLRIGLLEVAPIHHPGIHIILALQFVHQDILSHAHPLWIHSDIGIGQEMDAGGAVIHSGAERMIVIVAGRIGSYGDRLPHSQKVAALVEAKQLHASLGDAFHTLHAPIGTCLHSIVGCMHQEGDLHHAISLLPLWYSGDFAVAACQCEECNPQQGYIPYIYMHFLHCSVSLFILIAGAFLPFTAVALGISLTFCSPPVYPLLPLTCRGHSGQKCHHFLFHSL